MRRAGALLIAGIAAGLASLPAWVLVIGVSGWKLGLAPIAPRAAWLGGPLLWAAVVLLAPVFEELLYRERVLGALRGRVTAPLALVASSALFAAPHLEPWFVFGTFLVGMILGAIYLVSRSIALCIGLHMGLNAGALTFGIPPFSHPLSPETAALVGGVVLAGALLVARVRSRELRSSGGSHGAG